MMHPGVADVQGVGIRHCSAAQTSVPGRSRFYVSKRLRTQAISQELEPAESRKPYSTRPAVGLPMTLPCLTSQERPLSSTAEATTTGRQQGRTTKLPRHMHAVHHRVLSDVRSRRLLSKGERLLLPVDGSQASVCLLQLMHDLAPAWQWQLLVTFCHDATNPMHPHTADYGPGTPITHTNHPRHARMQQMAQVLGIPFVSLQQDLLQHSTGHQTHSRSSRADNIHTQYSTVLHPADQDTSSLSTLHGIAIQLQCSAVITTATATDCATQLLLDMLQPAEQQPYNISPTWEYPIPSQPQSITSDPDQLSSATCLPPTDGMGHRRFAGACRVVQPLMSITRPQLDKFTMDQDLLHWVGQVTSTTCHLPSPPSSHIGPFSLPVMPHQHTILPLRHNSYMDQPPVQLAASWKAVDLLPRSASVTTSTPLMHAESWQRHPTQPQPAMQGHSAQLPSVLPMPAAAASTSMASLRTTSAGAAFVHGTLLPLLRQHFNPASDLVLARMARILHDNAQTALPQQAPSVRVAMASGQHSPPDDHVGRQSVGMGMGVDSLRQLLLDHVHSHKLLSHGARIFVAVSGGQDSLCLLRLLYDLAPNQGWTLTVGHCDHGWRADSHANALHIQQLCASWSLPCLVRTAPDPSLIATEAQAREWRYQSLADMAWEAGCDVVVTGHTLTDVVETQMLNLLRGTGPEGMMALKARRSLCRRRQQQTCCNLRARTGSRPGRLDLHRSIYLQQTDCICKSRRKLKLSVKLRLARRPRWQYRYKRQAGQQLVRPQLVLTREDTGRICTELGLPVWLDSTNEDASIARRNRLRLDVMPLLRGQFGRDVERTLLAMGQRMARQAWALQQATRQLLRRMPWLQRVVVPALEVVQAGTSGSGCWVHHLALNRHALSQQSPAIQREVVRTFLLPVPGMASQLSFEIVEQVLLLLTAPNRTRTSTLMHGRMGLVAHHALVLDSMEPKSMSVPGSKGLVQSVRQGQVDVLRQACAVTAQVHEHQVILVFSC